jgi:hypothetical protein
MKFWRITISISPDSFRMDQHAEDTVESAKEWAAPELTRIDVEECTSQLFPLGEEDGAES